jgi:RimJ/RimL family protein N-acetyltransferase
MAGVEPLSTCFGQLNLCRIRWTVDGMNVRALEREGFVREGLLRSHRDRVDLTRAETVVYSRSASNRKHGPFRGPRRTQGGGRC